MKYRIFGKTNLKVSEIGYGTWQIANDPHMWVGATKEESKKSFRCCTPQKDYHSGINKVLISALRRIVFSNFKQSPCTILFRYFLIILRNI